MKVVNHRKTASALPGLGVPGRWRRTLQRSLLERSWGLTALALVTGVGAGLGAVAFRYMILGFTHLFTGHHDYSAAGHAPNPLVPGLGFWLVVFVPVIGGLLYGPLVIALRA